MIISFIIIGKNEGWKLTKCFDSVVNFVDSNLITDYELIYVDSKSSDDSIERAKTFPGIKIFQITGDCNAAVARNIGAMVSKGDILFFIDGDMELLADFYKSVLNQEKNLIYPFVSGGLINYNYDSNWNLKGTSNYSRNVKVDKYEHTTGGIFIIERELWEEVNGMRTKFKVNEDIDFGLRLSKLGYPILRKKEIIANHHTIPYNDIQRIFKQFLNGYELYPMVLFREHLLCIPSFHRFLFQNYTMLFLIISIIYINLFQNYITLVMYSFLIFIKSYIFNKKLNFGFLVNFIKFVLRDIIRLIALFLFYPNNISIKYSKIDE